MCADVLQTQLELELYIF